MGHQANVKVLRGQLRQIVQELLPSLVTAEVKAKMHEELRIEVNKRLDNVTKSVKDTLDTIDQRSKDIQGYLVRQTLQNPASPEVSLEPKTE